MEPTGDSLSQDEVKAAVRAVFKRCQTDWEFRQLCLRDAAAAIREISGKSLPEGYTMQFQDAQNKTG